MSGHVHAPSPKLHASLQVARSSTSLSSGSSPRKEITEGPAAKEVCRLQLWDIYIFRLWDIYIYMYILYWELRTCKLQLSHMGISPCVLPCSHLPMVS